MFPYQRLYDVFDYIQNNSIALPKNVANFFNVSVRTIRSDIVVMNDVLKVYDMEIYLKRNKGYEMKIQDSSLYQEFMTLYQNHNTQSVVLETTQEKLSYMVCQMILSKDISIEVLSDKLYVSQTTIQNYMRTIKKDIKKYHLKVIDYHIDGQEQDLRTCFIDYLYDDKTSLLTPLEKDYFQSLHLEHLRSLLMKTLQMYQISINDFALKRVLLSVAMMIRRLQEGHEMIGHLLSEQDEILLSLVEELEKYYHIHINGNEQSYLKSLIHRHVIEKKQLLNVNQLVDDFINHTYQNYSFDFREDDLLKEELKKHLSSPSIQKNPFLETIKSKFPLPYEISFLYFVKTMKEDDIAYIALYVASAMERNLKSKKMRQVILVSDAPGAIVNILKTRIETYFSNILKVIDVVSYHDIHDKSPLYFNNVDFILTTLPIRIPYCPVLRVDFTLTDEDIESISKMVNTSSKRSVGFFDENLFILNQTYLSKEDLLKDMAHLLYQQDIVDYHYYDDVMKREQLGGTSIGDLFALPHAVNSHSQSTKVVVAILKEAMIWEKEKMAQIIFLLVTDENKTNIGEVYNIAIDIANDVSLQKKLLKIKDFHEFMNLFF